MLQKIFRYEFTNNVLHVREFKVIDESEKCVRVRNYPVKRVQKNTMGIVSSSSPEYPMWSMTYTDEDIKRYRIQLKKAMEHTLNLCTEKCCKIKKSIKAIEDTPVDAQKEKIVQFIKGKDGVFNKVNYFVTRRTPDTIDICAEIDDIDGVCAGETGMPLTDIGKMMANDKFAAYQYVWAEPENDLAEKWSAFKAKA